MRATGDRVRRDWEGYDWNRREKTTQVIALVLLVLLLRRVFR